MPLSRATSDTNLARIHASVVLEDRIEMQHREIQTLLGDNQRLAATHVALKQELAASKRELQHLLETAEKVKASRGAQVREVYQKSLKMEAEVRVIELLKSELDQVRNSVQKLTANKQELATELEAVDFELAKLKSDSHRVPKIKAEIETLQAEIQRGRAAVEHEKKTRDSNLQHKFSMERNMGLLACEIEKLQADLAKAENKAREAAATAASITNPLYAADYGNPMVAYGGRPFPEPYGIPQVMEGTHSLPPHHVSGATQHGTYEAHY